MKELNEDTGFKISVKTLIAIGFAMATLIGFYFTLQADIAEAKELPKPEISRTEFDLKDKMIRETIINTKEDVEEIKETQSKMDEKIDRIEQKLFSL
jgi:hypothetical protein|tara:strand:- start:1203 stop:1493 length:291 start_codon:yes stop_codon:yes gene_type:complete